MAIQVFLLLRPWWTGAILILEHFCSPTKKRGANWYSHFNDLIIKNIKLAKGHSLEEQSRQDSHLSPVFSPTFLWILFMTRRADGR